MKAFFFPVSIVLTLSLSAVAAARPKDFDDFALQVDANYQLNLDNLLGQDRLTVSDLQAAKASFNNYNDFLAYLFQLKPQLFENFILIHDTGSIQFASLARPRVVLFGEGLFLAFSENPATNYRNVEVIEFDEETYEFVFHEIRFDEGNIEFEVNPASCQSCHGTPLKPIWDPYDFWPGIYGSAIARLGSDREKQGYEQLRAETNKFGIFRYLKLQNVGNGRLLGVEAFSQYVTQLHLMALMKQWQKHQEQLDPFIYVIMGVLSQCAFSTEKEALVGGMSDFFPEPIRSIMEPRIYPSYLKTVQDRNAFKKYLLDRYEDIFPGNQKIFNMDQQRLSNESISASQLRLIFEILNIPYSHMMMSQGQNPSFLSVPGNINADFLTNLIFYDLNLVYELQPKLNTTPSQKFKWLRYDCQDLKSRSKRALADISLEDRAPFASSQPSVIGQCINCHVMNRDSSHAPHIPFDRTAPLREWLVKDNYAGLAKIQDRIHRHGAGRMPPGKPLSEQEKNALEDVLEVLIKITARD